MPRIYTQTLNAATLSTTKDLISIKAGATNLVRLKRVELAEVDNPLQAAEDISVIVSRFTSGATQGTGGTVQTPVPDDPGDPASTSIVHTQDGTTQTAGGVASLLRQWGFYLYQSLDKTLGGNAIALAGQILVITIGTPLAAAPNCNLVVTWEEEG